MTQQTQPSRISATSARLAAALALIEALNGEALAQQYVYPSKGQSPQQQKRDEAACYTWAVQQSGFDPAKPLPSQPAAKPPTTASGTTPGAGVRGAARGAVVGEIVGGDAGAGAAAGAVAARGQSRRHNAAAAGQAQQQQQAAAQQQYAAFARARAACLEGRGYTPSSEPASDHRPVPYQGGDRIRVIPDRGLCILSCR